MKTSAVITPEVLEGMQNLQAKWGGLNGEINNAEHIIWGMYHEQKLPTDKEVLQVLSCLRSIADTILPLQGE